MVRVVERDDADSTRRSRQVRTDGGDRLTASEIGPSSVDTLRSFLDDQADASAFAIECGDGDQRRIVADVRVDEHTVRRPAAAITVECTGLPPGTGRVRVRVEDIQYLQVVDPPDELFTVAAETLAERAANVAELADVAPDRVPMPTVVPLLEADETAVREDALYAVERVANSRPQDCLTALPTLRDALGSATIETAVLDSIASIAVACPDEVVPLADDIMPYLLAEDAELRAPAAHALSEVADHAPVDVLDAVPAFSSLVAEREPGFEHALFALNRVAPEHPEELRPAASTLVDALADASLDTTARLNATAALGRTANEFPDAAVEAVDVLCDLLDAEDYRLRANAAGVLSDVATVHAGTLVPHVKDLVPLLKSDDDYTLVNTTAALARVAETEPSAVDHTTERYIALLDHDHRLVRLNACWALGHLRANEAAPNLDALQTADDDEQVRKRASWAFSEVERGR